MSEIQTCSDRWIISSLLQKAIRRGEDETASRAASRLFELCGAAIWRRFVVIAFEDVGVGSLAAVSSVSSAHDPDWRKEHGTDHDLAIGFARALANSIKSRGTENVWTTACHSPSAAIMREAVRETGPDMVRRALQEPKLPLLVRASHIAVHPRIALGRPDQWLQPLLSSNPGPEANAVLNATLSAARVTREAFVLLLPLIWMQMRNAKTTVASTRAPKGCCVGDLPLYALDKHTRLGRAAIRLFAGSNPAVRAALRAVASGCRLQAAYMAAFYTDAIQIDRKLSTTKSRRFEEMAMQADLLRTGVSLPSQATLQAAFAENLEHLNQVRAEIYARGQQAMLNPGDRG